LKESACDAVKPPNQEGTSKKRFPAAWRRLRKPPNQEGTSKKRFPAA